MDPYRIERQQPREYGRLLGPKHSPRKRLKEVMVKIDKSWSDNAPAKADPLLAFGDRSIGGSEIDHVRVPNQDPGVPNERRFSGARIEPVDVRQNRSRHKPVPIGRS